MLLSFDLEEFDIPEEYGQKLDKQTQLSVSNLGLKPLLALLSKYNVQATFFITAYYAENHPELVKEISLKHEIASHAYYHSTFKTEDLRNSKLKLEEISAQEVIGFRFPRLRQVSKGELKKAGYLYDSSLNPTYLPGRYNHLNKPRTIFAEEEIIEIPTSVVPVIRFPLFWLSFKNLPLPIINLLSAYTLRKDHYLCLYFHPWEFADIRSYQLPGYIKNNSGNTMLSKMEKYLHFLKGKGDFISHKEYLKKSNWI